MILRVVKGSIAEGPAILAVGCGVRLGEALALRWQDCDIEGSRMRVTGTMHRGGRTEPKTPRSRRTVAVPGFALGWLKEHRTAQAARRLASAAWLEDGYVFDRGGGVPMSVESVGRRFAQLVETVGLEQVRFHDLRHAFDPATRGEHQPEDRLRGFGSCVRLDHARRLQPCAALDVQDGSGRDRGCLRGASRLIRDGWLAAHWRQLGASSTDRPESSRR
jgi:hypothetical protein